MTQQYHGETSCLKEPFSEVENISKHLLFSQVSNYLRHFSAWIKVKAPILDNATRKEVNINCDIKNLLFLIAASICILKSSKII